MYVVMATSVASIKHPPFTGVTGNNTNAMEFTIALMILMNITAVTLVQNCCNALHSCSCHVVFRYQCCMVITNGITQDWQ
jgi:low affinity Fe/Cu permease